MTTTLNKSLFEFLSTSLKQTDLNRAYIDYVAIKAVEIEKKCIGRLATTIQDAVIRQIVAETLPNNYLGLLEIGTLYGISLVFIYNQCFSKFSTIKVIGLDPLNGYYDKPIDTKLNLPINARCFHRNMLLGDVPFDSYRLIQHYSNEISAINDVRQERINLLVLDGNHTYKGVMSDYENYFPILESGGFVIFDDYGTREWPDVTNFVDNVVKKDTDCEFIGSFSRTAICRKRQK